MKHRVLGVTLFGLGVLLLVLAVGLPLYVAPAVAQLPYDLSKSTSVAEAQNATFPKVTAGKMELKSGLLRSSTHVTPQPKLTDDLSKELKGEAVIWDVYGIAVDKDDATITAYTAELALDRVSGAAYDWSGAWIDEKNLGRDKAEKIEFAGQSYKFPFGTEKKDYQFWDASLRQANPISFQGVETIGGLETYVFRQEISLRKVTMAAEAKGLVIATFAPGAKGGDLYYSNIRTVWVEPVTGQFLNVREQRHQEFRADNGVTKTLLDADFKYTQATVDAAVKNAGGNKMKINAIQLYAPIGLGLLGLLLIGFAVFLMSRGARPARHALDTTQVG